MKLTNKGSNHDPDTYLETSAGYCEIDAEKSPVGFYRGWYYYVIKFNERNSVLQVITPDNATTKECYFRKGHGASDGTYSWTSWSLWPYDIPSFYKDYADLSSLASALGVGMNRSDNQNMENMLTSGWYQGNYWTGIPSGANNTACTAYVYEAFPIELIHQLFIDSSGKHYFRTRFGSVWTNWSEFSTDIPTFYKNYTDLNSLASALGVKQWNTLTVASLGEAVIFNNSCVFELSFWSDCYGIVSFNGSSIARLLIDNNVSTYFEVYASDNSVKIRNKMDYELSISYRRIDADA